MIRSFRWAVVRSVGAALVVLGILSAPAGGAVPGRGFGWGDNNNGQLGDGTGETAPNRTKIAGLSRIRELAAGHGHSLALTDDGSVWSWGANADGELGNGTSNDALTPTAVARIANIKTIGAGAYHGLAVTQGGRVWAWGLNDSGQLGLDPNTTSHREIPVKLPDLTNVVAVAGGYDFSVALKENGDVLTWGNGSNGSLGDGSTDPRFEPEKVPGIGNVKKIAASMASFHVVVLMTDGTVKTWGPDSSTPIDVSDLANVKAVQAGESHSLALKRNGTVWGWGDNQYGQLGDRDDTQDQDPGRVPGVNNVIAIAAGSNHSLALLEDRTLRAWGRNEHGELGDGNVGTTSEVPVAVQGVTGVRGIAAGDRHSLARR